MQRRQRHRLTTTILVVMALLFSQSALASYVCPGQTDAAVMAAMMASGEPCTGMDEAQPSLCHQHAANAAQSTDVVKLPVLSLQSLPRILLVPAVMETHAAPATPRSAASETRPPPDPLFLSTLRLRV